MTEEDGVEELAKAARRANMGKLYKFECYAPAHLLPELRAIARRHQVEILRGGTVAGVAAGTKSGSRVAAVYDLLVREDRPLSVRRIMVELDQPEYSEDMQWHQCGEEARLTYVRRALAGLIATGRVRRDGRQFTAITNNSSSPA